MDNDSKEYGDELFIYAMTLLEEKLETENAKNLEFHETNLNEKN